MRQVRVGGAGAGGGTGAGAGAGAGESDPPHAAVLSASGATVAAINKRRRAVEASTIDDVA
jgi:hypothetical protein